MSHERSDRYAYSAPGTRITLGSDRAATSAGPRVADVSENNRAKTDQLISSESSKFVLRAEDETSEVSKETLSTTDEALLETLEQRSERTEDLETDRVRLRLIRHCFSGSNLSSNFIRSDIVALGFGQFEKKFEPDRILCLFETIDRHVSLVFFHVEGMATLFGIGLPSSEVLLKEDRVEIREIQDGVWRNRWKEPTGDKHSYPLLFVFEDNNKSFKTGTPVSVSEDPKHVMSMGKAAERFGVGVDGLNEFTGLTSELENISHTFRGEQPPWVDVIYRALLERGKCEWQNIMTSYKRNITSVSSGDDNVGRSSEGVFSSSSQSHGVLHLYMTISNNLFSFWKDVTGIGLASDENNCSQTHNKPLQLTVRVYLDPSGYSLCGPLPDTAELSFTKVAGKVRSTEDVFQFSDYEMVPTVILHFFYDPGEGRQAKRLVTTLDSRFHMDGSIADEKLFGWYHDELRLSFKCLESNSVMRVKNSPDEEILSQHECRYSGKERVSEAYIISVKGGGKEFEVVGGYEPIAQVRLKGSSDKELTKGNTTTDHITGQVVAICLKNQNFAVNNVEGGSQEFAYQATIFPPIAFYNKWSMADRELAKTSGMMSNVELQIVGNWIVKEQDDTTSPQLVAYEFLCQRKLAQHRLEPPKRIKTRKFWRQEEKGKDLEEHKLQLQQKLSRCFMVNHSFSHMTFQRFWRSEAYEWDMTHQFISPVEEIVR